MKDWLDTSQVLGEFDPYEVKTEFFEIFSADVILSDSTLWSSKGKWK